MNTKINLEGLKRGGELSRQCPPVPLGPKWGGFAMVLSLFLGSPQPGRAAYTIADDLPNPPAHLELIPAGSWIIPMDTNLQSVVAPFNLKSYGLANQVLQSEHPIAQENLNVLEAPTVGEIRAARA